MSRDKDGSVVVTASRAPDGFETDHTPLSAQGTEQRGDGVKETQNGRHKGCRQLGKEQNDLEEASSLSECSSSIGQPTTVKSRRAKPHGGTVSREKGQSPREQKASAA